MSLGLRSSVSQTFVLGRLFLKLKGLNFLPWNFLPRTFVPQTIGPQPNFFPTSIFLSSQLFFSTRIFSKVYLGSKVHWRKVWKNKSLGNKRKFLVRNIFQTFLIFLQISLIGSVMMNGNLNCHKPYFLLELLLEPYSLVGSLIIMDVFGLWW